MKKYNFLWMSVFMLSGLIANGQMNKSLKTDPVAQLKQLIAIPSIKKVSVNSVTIPMLSPESLMVGYDIKKTVEEAKMRCPLLHFESSLELEGERNSNEEVGLEWKTTNAFGSLYFDVERSLEDTLHFEKVNFVWSKDREAKEKYQLPDNNEYEAVSYYRVKLQLKNGNFRYSNVIAVNGYNRFLFTVFPNPASEKVLVNLTSKTGGIANISLFNGEGKMVMQQFPLLVEGINYKELNIARLPAGVYTIKAILPEKEMRSGRLIKY